MRAQVTSTRAAVWSAHEQQLWRTDLSCHTHFQLLCWAPITDHVFQRHNIIKEPHGKTYSHTVAILSQGKISVLQIHKKVHKWILLFSNNALNWSKVSLSISNKCCSFEKKFQQKYQAAQLFSALIITRRVLSSKSIYQNDVWRIMWHWRLDKQCWEMCSTLQWQD